MAVCSVDETLCAPQPNDQNGISDKIMEYTRDVAKNINVFC